MLPPMLQLPCQRVTPLAIATPMPAPDKTRPMGAMDSPAPAPAAPRFLIAEVPGPAS
jgi:hypothetical protein